MNPVTAAAEVCSPADLIARRPAGQSLEAPFYVGQEFFDLDIEAVFARSWLFVAAEAELPEPGDYVTVTIGSYSVIVVRDDDEDVRAFHNVCRHRGARILNEERGSVGNIVCGYHRWTYGVDGRLLHAESQAPGFDPSCFGLRTVHARTVAGLVFICLADEPPADFDEVAARIEPYLAPHNLAKAKVATQIDLIENGNWKLTMENNRECYHCVGHPELQACYFPIYGYQEQDIPPALRPAYERFQRADAVARKTYDSLGLPYAEIEELDTRPTGFRIQREPSTWPGSPTPRTARPRASGCWRTSPRPAWAGCRCTSSPTPGSTSWPTTRSRSARSRSARTAPSSAPPGSCTPTPWRGSTTTSTR